VKKHVVIGIGEILWDLLPEGKQLGGAPANFAYHAMALGAQSYIVSAVGCDDSGREILEHVLRVGLDPEYIAIDPKYPTGTVTVQVDAKGIPSFIIHEGVAWDNIVLTGSARNLAATADAVCFGTLAQRSAMSRSSILCLLEFVPTDCLCIYDVNLRQSYYSKEIVLESLRQCDVLKLNSQELPVVAGLLSISGSESEILQRMIRDYDLKLVALTLGEKGSRLASPGDVSFMDAPKVPVVDTVGAGDAFTAALTVGLLEQLPLRVIHDNATRLAGFVCTQHGAIAEMTAIREFMGET
jgi:fructokinase